MSAFFSNRFKWLKALGLWAIFLSMVVLYGRFEARRYEQGIVAQVTSGSIPTSGVAYALSFTRLRPGPPLEIHTPLGWTPLVVRGSQPLELGVSTSVIGYMTPGGTLIADSLHYHPLRGVKTWLSLATLVGVLGLAILRPRRCLLPAPRGYPPTP